MFDFLRKIPLFSGLSNEDLSRLCGMVKEVHLEVGELTFLGHDQLRFGFGILVRSEPKIDPDGLNIISIPAKIKCLECDYEGAMEVQGSEEYHIKLPRFACPSCGGAIDILRGKECMVKNLVMDLEDD